MSNNRVEITRSFLRDGFSVFISCGVDGNWFAIERNPRQNEVSPIHINTEINSRIEPLLDLTREQVVCLMDSLWSQGIRPTDQGTVNGELKATRDALERERVILDTVLPHALRKREGG